MCPVCRAISVILGERWKKMKGEERRVFTMEAKTLADEQKRLNPDCWKRKRNNSVWRAHTHTQYSTDTHAFHKTKNNYEIFDSISNQMSFTPVIPLTNKHT